MESDSEPRSLCFALKDIDHRSLTDSLKSCSHIFSIDSIYSLIFPGDHCITITTDVIKLKRAIKIENELSYYFFLYFP